MGGEAGRRNGGQGSLPSKGTPSQSHRIHEPDKESSGRQGPQGRYLGVPPMPLCRPLRASPVQQHLLGKRSAWRTCAENLCALFRLTFGAEA